jgi:hypothetical protein
MTDFSPLRGAVAGPVLTPADDEFADELSGFNLFWEHTPDVVVGVTSADDVAATMRFAREHSLPVRVFSTGHGSHESLTEGIVLSVKRLSGVSIDPATRIATIGGGTTWGPVIEAAAAHGLAPIAGSAATVGAVGYLLGGGLGPLARSHGFSSDWVRGFSVVSGTGEIITATAEENPELFWALRGGKGGLGVVTEVLVELVPIAELYAGNILFPTSAVEPVLRAWSAFTRTAPADVTTSVAVMRLPPIEQIPEPLRGQTVLALRFAYPGAASEGERILAPLRSVAPAILDTVRPMPLAEIASVHADPTEPGKSTSSGAMLASVDYRTLDALLEVVGPGRNVPLVAVELRHVGGATRTDVAGESAVGGRTADYSLVAIGSLMQPGILPAVDAATTALMAALEEWISPETTINFAGAPRTADDFARAWPAPVFERLSRIRRTVDPDRVLPYGFA